MAKRAQGSALDCSRLRPCVFWFSIGLLLGLAAMRGQGAPNWASLLRVGSSNPFIGQIQRELGPVHPPDPVGHDGQLFFLIARDPVNAFGTAQRLAEFDNNPPRYRYRRILYPLLAGGFGQFNGRVTLAGMILLTAVGLGLTAVAIADLAHSLNLSGGVVFAGILNLGALISAMLLTADALALGLALGGLALVCRSRTGWAVTAFALAALTKEVYAIIPVSIGAFYVRERFLRRGLIVALVPLLPLLIWTAWVWMKIPDAPATATNLGIPFRGIIESLPSWRERYPGDLASDGRRDVSRLRVYHGPGPRGSWQEQTFAKHCRGLAPHRVRVDPSRLAPANQRREGICDTLAAHVAAVGGPHACRSPKPPPKPKQHTDLTGEKPKPAPRGCGSGHPSLFSDLLRAALSSGASGRGGGNRDRAADGTNRRLESTLFPLAFARILCVCRRVTLLSRRVANC